MGSGVKLVRQIQQALKEKGFDPGEADGIWGRKTIAAIKQFQISSQLEVVELSDQRYRGTKTALSRCWQIDGNMAIIADRNAELHC